MTAETVVDVDDVEPEAPDQELIDLLEGELERIRNNEANLALMELYDNETVPSHPDGGVRETKLARFVYKAGAEVLSGAKLDAAQLALGHRRRLIEDWIEDLKDAASAHAEWSKRNGVVSTKPASQQELQVLVGFLSGEVTELREQVEALVARHEPQVPDTEAQQRAEDASFEGRG